MPRKKGSKNIVPSRVDYNALSIEAIRDTMNYIIKYMQTDSLPSHQLEELTTILKKMDSVVNGYNKHIKENKRGTNVDL